MSSRLREYIIPLVMPRFASWIQISDNYIYWHLQAVLKFISNLFQRGFQINIFHTRFCNTRIYNLFRLLVHLIIIITIKWGLKYVCVGVLLEGKEWLNIGNNVEACTSQKKLIDWLRYEKVSGEKGRMMKWEVWVNEREYGSKLAYPMNLYISCDLYANVGIYYNKAEGLI